MAKNFVTLHRGENYTPNREYPVNIKNELMTPDFFSNNYEQLDLSFENIGQMKKSLSMSDIAAIRDDLVNLNFQDNHKDDIYERYRRPSTASNQPLCKNKFVSVAEAIYHFQRDTPDRFRTSRTTNVGRFERPLRLTRPQSPVLLSRTRSRTRTHFLSQKEKEDMEIEELKKFKIKAHPIPKCVIEGSRNLPDVPRRPNTVPEPFKLTEVIKRPAYNSPIPAFKARPVPKHIFEKSQIPVKTSVSATKPVSPKFHYKNIMVKNNAPLCQQNGQDHVDKTKHKPESRHDGRIHPIPFSFEKRDEESKRKKDEKIKHQIEAEKQVASQFKAKPVPGMVRKTMHIAVKSSATSTTSSENKENYHFEARPPTVLYKKPFKPDLHLIEPTNPIGFDLSTDKRALERRQFDNQIKLKEEEMEQLRKEKDKEIMENERKQIAELRSQLVHHAKPVCIKSPYVPQKSLLPITCPETPQFVRRLNQKSAK